jgi:hypothetical protein
MGAVEILREGIESQWDYLIEGQGARAEEFLQELERRVADEGIPGIRQRYCELGGSVFDFQKRKALALTLRTLPHWAVFVIAEPVGQHLQVKRLTWYERALIYANTPGLEEARTLARLAKLHIEAICKELGSDEGALSRTGKWFLEYW